MIVPVGPEGGTQFFTQFDKDEAGNISTRELMSVLYVPLTDKSKQIGRTLLWINLQKTGLFFSIFLNLSVLNLKF